MTRAISRFEVEVGRPAPHALPWYQAIGDTAAILQVIRRSDSLQSGSHDPLIRRTARYRSASAKAYLALARGDSATGLALLLNLPDTLCMSCFADRLHAARLANARGRFEAADHVLVERLQALVPILEPEFLEARLVSAGAGKPESAERGAAARLRRPEKRE
jgi:hypothetical protein